MRFLNEGELIKEIQERYMEYAMSPKERDAYLELLDYVPSANVRPEIIAEWQSIGDEVSYNGFWTKWKCSFCGNQYIAEEEATTYRYCPYCGAKMRKRVNRDDSTLSI